MLALDRSSLGSRLAAATIFGAVVLADPFVATAEPLHVATKAKTAPSEQRDDVQARIKTLHAQLGITAAQESGWKDVAQSMRDNAKAMADNRDRQASAEKTASAPEMISAYGKTMDAHAEAIHRFATTFQGLYDGMSDTQKKTADDVFRRRVHEAAARRKS